MERFVKDSYDPEAWKAWAPKVRVRLPPQRKKVMEYVTEELAAGRSFPGPVAIARYMGWKSSGSAADTLFKLCSYDKALKRMGGKYIIREDVDVRAA